MATKKTKDNTYYSLAKGFHFSSIISILAPLVYIILTIICDCTKSPEAETLPDWYVKGIVVVGSIALAFAAIWIVLAFVMFFTAGNLRGIKSPLGIRVGLLITIILVSACEIVSLLKYAGVIPDFEKEIFNQLIHYGSQALVLIGYIVGAGISSSIKKALRN